MMRTPKRDTAPLCLSLMLLIAILAGEAKADWSTPPVEQDRAEGGQPCDWVAFFARMDQGALQLAYRCAAPVEVQRGAAYCLYLDVDGKRNTGFRGGDDSFPIGADFLLQGYTLYRYTGDGQVWSWSSEGEVPYSITGTWAEFTLAPALLNLAGREIHAFLLGDNTADGMGGSTNDELPDGALRTGGGGRFLRIPVR